MKKALRIYGNIYDTAKITMVYAGNTGKDHATKPGYLYECRIIIDGTSEHIAYGTRDEMIALRDKIIEAIAPNTEIIDI